jgi:hypothetical protein
VATAPQFPTDAHDTELIDIPGSLEPAGGTTPIPDPQSADAAAGDSATATTTHEIGTNTRDSDAAKTFPPSI